MTHKPELAPFAQRLFGSVDRHTSRQVVTPTYHLRDLST